ncbi:MAG TPA: hypothetical protein VGQ36_28950 [Thermoanaerobaculia bacterium]|nr:hypothetical protein [Thermoanaerobaculia bacterium]
MLPLLAADPPGLLVRYSFDDGLTDTGPDTFAVFQNAKGHVRLSPELRYSGYRSIELRDVAGDGDFPELQGYFPERKDGSLYFHFAMLVANPDQPLNVALAGRSHFSVTEHGIAFWLKTRDSTLFHVSDSIPKKLFRVEAFTWYVVDARLDITRGTYDLTIRSEGAAEPIVALKDQPNAANAPGSSVDKFSFVGSVFEDDSNVTFYVDDVVLGTDRQVILGPFVAPGRRKLFIDRWRETRALMLKNPGCPPVLSFQDFGLTEPPADGEGAPAAYHVACAAMKKDPVAAAKQFRELATQNPQAPIFAIAELAALVESEDEAGARRRWQELEPLLQHDVRYGMLAAMMGLESEQQDDETRYFVLLWKGEFARAASLAEKNEWPERAADALFLSGSHVAARKLYEQALRDKPNAYWPTVKLSDVAHVLGDARNEKVYRERMYGALRE